MVQEMDCNEIQKLLISYGDGELEPRLREAVEEHLSSCVTCRHEHDQLVAALDAFLALGRNAAPRPPRNALAEEIVQKAGACPGRLSTARWLFPVAAAAVLILGVTLGLLWMSRLSTRSQSPSVPGPVATEHPEPARSNNNSVDALIAQGLFEARLAAAKAASADGANTPVPAVPDVCLTASDLYAQIPAIMLVAADQVNYAVGDKKEAARKYERIVELFPDSKQARIAAARLTELRQQQEEG